MDCPDLLVIRHGETEWNRARRWQGRLDSPLTPLGQAQAHGIGRLLRDLGIGPRTHRHYVSPLGRARATAALILDGAGEALVDPRLAEIDVGGFAGLTREEIVARAGLGATAHFLDHYRTAPGGEGLEALWIRVSGFLADLRGPAVVVTHGITSRFLRAAALGLGPEGAADLPGGQGVVHRIRAGRHEEIAPDPITPDPITPDPVDPDAVDPGDGGG